MSINSNMSEIPTSEFGSRKDRDKFPELLTEEEIENLEPTQIVEHLVSNEALQRELFGRVFSAEELPNKISLQVVKRVLASLGVRFNS
jgi:hypothetical protein